MIINVIIILIREGVNMFKKSLFLLLVSLSAFGAPKWYEMANHYSHGSVYYGYGEGETLKDAKLNAASEISEQISTTISSRTQIESSLEDDTYKNRMQTDMTSISNATLKEMHLLKKSMEDGRYYILLEYRYTTPLWFEQRSVDAPLFSKVGYGFGNDPTQAHSNAIKDLQAQHIVLDEKKMHTVKSDKVNKKYFYAVAQQDIQQLPCTTKQNPFLKRSPLIKKANALTPCPYDYNLQHLNKKWYLHYKTVLFPLSPQKFDALFIDVSSAKVELKSPQSTFVEGDGFNLYLKSYETGYLSLFDVYDDGRVGVLFENRAIKKGESFLFPSLESKQEFVATLMTPTKATKDLYVAVLSRNRLNLSSFEQQEGLLIGEQEFRFNEVIALCRDHACTSIVLKTKPQ